MKNRLTDLEQALKYAQNAGDQSAAAALADMLLIEQNRVKQDKIANPAKAEWEE